jgi:hypothetical protein
MHSNAEIARALAAAFVAGPIEHDALIARGATLFGKRWRWLGPLARQICAEFADRPRPRQATVADFILGDSGFYAACERHRLTLVGRLAVPAAMGPVTAAAGWNLLVILTPGEFADWLGVSVRDLDWFADRRHLESKQRHGRLRHYHYRVLAKRFGSVRLIEAPKPRLKELQRRILTSVLDLIPAHSAAHGFRRGRSIGSFAAPHVCKRVVARIDLSNFFPSISRARIQALFRTVGYPESVAHLLASLCCNSAPSEIWNGFESPLIDRQLRMARELYSKSHLPQGAPTSPALANLCAYRLDGRLMGLANAAGATYTRYADDLAFSGGVDFHRVLKRFLLHVCATVMEEGFSVEHRKTRVMRQGARQRLAGLVVNRRLNVARSDFDLLKATLTNCARHGSESQNRSDHPDFRGHLLGRIAFIEMTNNSRGQRLRELFDQIKW